MNCPTNPYQIRQASGNIMSLKWWTHKTSRECATKVEWNSIGDLRQAKKWIKSLEWDDGINEGGVYLHVKLLSARRRLGWTYPEIQ